MKIRSAEDVAATLVPSGRPFIDIAPSADGSFQLTVGLDLATIDEPTIKKAMVMVRNYKRLHVGRMEWAPRICDD